MRKMPKDATERRAAWRRARAVCGLTDGQIGGLMGRTAQLIRHYKCRSGSVPPWEAIEILREHNLKIALRTVEERFGPGAVTRLREAA